jgi:hypothetical protein
MKRDPTVDPVNVVAATFSNGTFADSRASGNVPEVKLVAEVTSLPLT